MLLKWGISFWLVPDEKVAADRGPAFTVMKRNPQNSSRPELCVSVIEKHVKFIFIFQLVFPLTYNDQINFFLIVFAKLGPRILNK